MRRPSSASFRIVSTSAVSLLTLYNIVVVLAYGLPTAGEYAFQPSSTGIAMAIIIGQGALLIGSTLMAADPRPLLPVAAAGSSIASRAQPAPTACRTASAGSTAPSRSGGAGTDPAPPPQGRHTTSPRSSTPTDRSSTMPICGSHLNLRAAPHRHRRVLTDTARRRHTA